MKDVKGGKNKQTNKQEQNKNHATYMYHLYCQLPKGFPDTLIIFTKKYQVI